MVEASPHAARPDTPHGEVLSGPLVVGAGIEGVHKLSRVKWRSSPLEPASKPPTIPFDSGATERPAILMSRPVPSGVGVDALKAPDS